MFCVPSARGTLHSVCNGELGVASHAQIPPWFLQLLSSCPHVCILGTFTTKIKPVLHALSLIYTQNSNEAKAFSLVFAFAVCLEKSTLHHCFHTDRTWTSFLLPLPADRGVAVTSHYWEREDNVAHYQHVKAVVKIIVFHRQASLQRSQRGAERSAHLSWCLARKHRQKIKAKVDAKWQLFTYSCMCLLSCTGID